MMPIVHSLIRCPFLGYCGDSDEAVAQGVSWRWRDLDWRQMRRIALRLLAGLVAVPVTYFLTALILGVVPANLGWREASEGVTIYVRTNGVHTWIMMPKV